MTVAVSSSQHSGDFVAFVYPGWHPDPYRPTVNEWELVNEFTPLFSGHVRGPRPLRGYYDDSDPKTIDQQIAEARNAGIAAFAYFSYYSAAGFVMDSPMRNAFLSRVEDFYICPVWCFRLPHDRFPVDLKESDVIQPSLREPNGRLEDVPIDQLTPSELTSLLAQDGAPSETLSTCSNILLAVRRGVSQMEDALNKSAAAPAPLFLAADFAKASEMQQVAVARLLPLAKLISDNIRHSGVCTLSLKQITDLVWPTSRTTK